MQIGMQKRKGCYHTKGVTEEVTPTPVHEVYSFKNIFYSPYYHIYMPVLFSGK